MAKSSIKQLASELNVDSLEIEIACVDVLGIDPDKNTEFNELEIERLRSHFSQTTPKKQLQAPKPPAAPLQRPQKPGSLADRQQANQSRQEEQKQKLTQWQQDQHQQQKNVVTTGAAQQNQVIQQLVADEIRSKSAIADVVSIAGQMAYQQRMQENQANFFVQLSAANSHVLTEALTGLNLGQLMAENNIGNVTESYEAIQPTDPIDFSLLQPASYMDFKNNSNDA